MLLEIFCSGPVQTNCILIACEVTRKGAIFDAPGSVGKHIIQRVKELQIIPEYLFLTHSHWDHIIDANYIKKECGVSLYVHELDAPNVENPGIDGLTLWVNVPETKVDHFLKDGEIFSIGKLHMQVIHTPGHTPGGVCFYFKEQHILITGDTFFKGSIGNLSFPTSEAEKMWTSLEKLSKLPPITRVIPGHGEETTIEAESWLQHAQEYFGGSL